MSKKFSSKQPKKKKERKTRSKITCVHWALFVKGNALTRKEIVTFYANFIFVNINLANVHLVSSPTLTL